MRYTTDYEEHRALPDGTRLVLRMVRPSDKGAFVRGLSHLSERTRYQRFMAPKNEFTYAELAFLTEIDGENHFAIVAGHERPGAEPEGIGVVRVVRLDDTQETAELGIVVVDAWQHRGIGRLLLECAVDAAAERGIKRVRALVRADNTPVLGLLRGYLADGEIDTDHGVQIREFPIAQHKANRFLAPGGCVAT